MNAEQSTERATIRFPGSRMHDIEPHFHWRQQYTSDGDPNSPFHGRVYSEFTFTNKVYNYYIHPQWDDFGSQTLYAKQLYADYEEGYVIIELIGEWNDSLYNDVKFLKEEIGDSLALHGIDKYIFICEHVLNFHGDDNCYYEEWAGEVNEEGGWIALINTLQHVQDELHDTQVDHYVYYGEYFNNLAWRPKKPADLYGVISALVQAQPVRLD